MLTRRQWYQTLAGLGIGGTTFQRALATQASQAEKKPASSAVTAEMIQQAEWISGITLTPAERNRLVSELTRALNSFQSLRKIPLTNDVTPALVFHPQGSHDPIAGPLVNRVRWSSPTPSGKPAGEEDLAFASIAALGYWLRTRQISSMELTRLYLDRLKRYDPALLCVVSLTEDLAYRQAAQADRELSAGQDRGPLHGIPWGAKDLIGYPGYKTTWGAGPYRDQSLAVKATVAEKLEEAGAVLIAKLTLGALAMGDRWFGGMTRNPWNVREGSSGSSAGSASAVAAGLVGFAIGTETYGSIVSPCTRCGATGLRPTFGRVSRHGCMALCWSMDKLGPIARSIEDCALVFHAIHGQDPRDPSTVSRSFQWPADKTLSDIKVGYVETSRPLAEREELKVLGSLGVQLIPIKLPTTVPAQALLTILTAEAGAAFDDLTRAGIKEGIGTWPTTFQQAQFIPAVEYLRANRLRSVLIRDMEKVFDQVDLYVAGNDLAITNLTGHPTVVMPNGYRKRGELETPTAITMTGRLFGEDVLMTVAHAYQEATQHHRKRPRMDLVTIDRRDPKPPDEKSEPKKPEKN